MIKLLQPQLISRRKIVFLFGALCFFVLTCNNVLAQNSHILDWTKTYNANRDDRPKCMLETSDGYIFGVDSESDADDFKTDPCYGTFDFWIIKTDKQGNKLWDKTFGKGLADYLMEIIPTSDGGFLLAGDTDSNLTGTSYDYWIVKIDSNGNKLWDKTFGGYGEELFKTVVETADGGFLLGGGTHSEVGGDVSESFKSPGTEFWIVKINSNGDKLWDKSFPGEILGNEESAKVFSSIQPTSDGGFLIGGTSDRGNLPSDQSQNYWIIKMSASGNIEWNKSFGGSKSDDLVNILESPGGGFFLIGNSRSPVSGNKTVAPASTSDGVPPHVWIVKINANGEKEWEKFLPPHPTLSNYDGYLKGKIFQNHLYIFKDSPFDPILYTLDLTGNVLNKEELAYTAEARGKMPSISMVFSEISSNGIVIGIVYANEDWNVGFSVLKYKLSTNPSPSVSITSPVSGTVYLATSNIVINADASAPDGGTISKLKFYINNEKVGEDSIAPYSFNIQSLTPGTYNITARAIDNLGSESSSSVAIKVVNSFNKLPVVNITYPIRFVTFSSPAVIVLNASASDPDGSISKVEFYNGATKLGEALTPPYSYIWNKAGIGAYGVYAVATDNSGGKTTSPVINVLVVTVPSAVATIYQHCNYNGIGYGAALIPGTYTLSQLQARGIKDNDISALKVKAGYEVLLYDNDNFSGTSVYAASDLNCLVANNFNDKTTSIVVRVVSASSQRVGNEINHGTRVTPNPFDDRLKITFAPGSESAEVKIFDVYNTEVYSSKINSEEEIDLKSLKSGVYILKVSTGGKEHLQRIIKN